MNAVRAPWQVWAIVALAPVLWLLYEAPGDPHFGDATRTAWMVGLALLLLLFGSKLAWILSTGGTGAAALIFIYQLFEPFGNEGSVGVQIALTAVTLAQFALFVSLPTMEWVGLTKDRSATRPPAEHAS